MSQNLALLDEKNKWPLDVVLHGDALERLRELPDESVHCVVSSPPYFGLRDYSVNGQLGSENTPDAFIERLVCVFREVRRVLRSDGVAWLNIGDSYAQDTKWGGSTGGKHSTGLHGTTGIGRQRTTSGLPGKNQMLIPFRLAIALQCDGWWVRSTIIWSKPNPMPASVNDRPTDSHEYIFLLTKNSDYWYDQDAIREPHADRHNMINGEYRAGGVNRQGWQPQEKDGLARPTFAMKDREYHPLGRNKHSVWSIPTSSSQWEFCGACNRLYEGSTRNDIGTRIEKVRQVDEQGKERIQAIKHKVCRCGSETDWIQHFAAYPPDLIEPCILAGCPHKVCADCGAPYVRVTETVSYEDHGGLRKRADAPGASVSKTSVFRTGKIPIKETLGFKPTCSCNAGTISGTVLDPFFGSGTTGIVARKWARHWLGIELNPDYVRVGQARCAVPVTLPMFLEV